MIRPPTRLVLLGHPVAHSLSPVFQNAALAAAGLPARYDALDVEPSIFAGAIAELRREGAAGNVTTPHKERMAATCDRLTSLAARVDAVNTFWVDDAGLLVGDNTDVDGFAAALTDLRGVAPADLTFGLIGAGGAAAAVLAAIERWPGCTAHVYNRTPERARLLSERFGSVANPVDDIGVIAGADIVINATTIGLSGTGLPINPHLIPHETTVMDLVYHAEGTPLVRALHARGSRAADGLAMLVEQGAIAFEKWYGVTPDRGAMWRSLGRR